MPLFIVNIIILLIFFNLKLKVSGFHNFFLKNIDKIIFGLTKSLNNLL